MSKITFNRTFVAIYDFVVRQRNVVIAFVVLLTIVSSVGVFFVKFENDIKFMLPDNSVVRESIDFFDSARIANNIVISMKLNSPDLSANKLISAVKEFTGSIDTPLISRVKNIAGSTNMIKDADGIIAYAPQLFDEKAMNRLKEEVSSDNIKEKFGKIYRLTLMPGGSFMAAVMLKDPFGLSLGVLNTLQKLSLTLGYDMVFEDGVLLNKDKSHAMVVMETNVSVTDSFASKELVSYVRGKLSALPDYISANIIAGHLHAIDNETVIRRDITLVSIAVLISFFIVFICVFKDLSTFTIFLIPFASVLVAICLTNFIFRQVSYFIAGMAAVITGIAIDYGIHVYSAVRASGGRSESVKDVAKPIMAGALTTMGVFGGFLFSRVPGYRQLAFFSVCGISLSLFYALFILPQILHGKRSVNFERVSKFIGSVHVVKRSVIYFWALFIIVAGFASWRITFANDVKQFDGTSKETLQGEEEFHKVWGTGESPAIFVSGGDTLEKAIAVNEQVYDEVTRTPYLSDFASVAEVWPSVETRESNIHRWKTFWSDTRKDEVELLFKENALKYGFNDNAFSPFFNSLAESVIVKSGLSLPPGIFDNIIERFVNESPGKYQVLSFFPDDEGLISALESITKKISGTFIISRKAFSRELSREITAEVIPLGIAAAIIIISLTMFFLRDVRLSIIALTPVVSAVIAIGGGLVLVGAPLDASSAVASLIVCGLCIDYGIFMVYSCKQVEKNSATATAVALSALTTLIGTSTLLLAKHPILFSIGRTITIGILAGFLTAFFVVPSIYALLIEGASRKRVVI